jgi:chromosome segregation ATPase
VTIARELVQDLESELDRERLRARDATKRYDEAVADIQSLTSRAEVAESRLSDSRGECERLRDVQTELERMRDEAEVKKAAADAEAKSALARLTECVEEIAQERNATLEIQKKLGFAVYQAEEAEKRAVEASTSAEHAVARMEAADADLRLSQETAKIRSQALSIVYAAASKLTSRYRALRVQKTVLLSRPDLSVRGMTKMSLSQQSVDPLGGDSGCGLSGEICQG